MGLILAGILLGALFAGLIVLCLSRDGEKEFVFTLLFLFAAFSVVFGVILGIGLPVSGYEQPQVCSTEELISLRDETVSEGRGGLFYVAVSATNTYTYYIEVDSPYVSDSQKAYKSKTISGSNVTIVEDDNYTEAKLVKYVKYGKKSFWTFAVGAEEYEYVFYVPTGTIARDVSLG